MTQILTRTAQVSSHLQGEIVPEDGLEVHSAVEDDED